MDRELMMLEDLRLLAAEINDLIFTLRDKFNPTLLRDELEGIIARRVLSLEIDTIREASVEDRKLYEVRFKNLSHRLHVPKQDTPPELYRELVKRFHQIYFYSDVAGRNYLLGVGNKRGYLLEEDGSNLEKGYCEVVRYTADLVEEYIRCRSCVEKAKGKKPDAKVWETVLLSVDEDEAKEDFMENCLVPCELIDLVDEVEYKFALGIDAELKKAYKVLLP